MDLSPLNMGLEVSDKGVLDLKHEKICCAIIDLNMKGATKQGMWQPV